MRNLPLYCAEKWESYGHKSLASAEKLAEIPQSEACWENSHAREGERLGARHSPRLPLSVHGVAKSRSRLSDFTFTFHFHALEKEMATHSSVLAWRISGTAEPGGLPSMGSHRVGHN